MSITPWDEMTRGWTEMYDQQAEMTKTWLDGQTQLANTLAASSATTPTPWRTPPPWPSYGGRGRRSGVRWVAPFRV